MFVAGHGDVADATFEHSQFHDAECDVLLRDVGQGEGIALLPVVVGHGLGGRLQQRKPEWLADVRFGNRFELFFSDDGVAVEQEAFDNGASGRLPARFRRGRRRSFLDGLCWRWR